VKGAKKPATHGRQGIKLGLAVQLPPHATLPFTGLALWMTLLLGLVLAGAGTLLRRSGQNAVHA